MWLILHVWVSLQECLIREEGIQLVPTLCKNNPPLVADSVLSNIYN